MLRLIFCAFALVASFLFFSSQALATSNDTYNFYFQKAPGPQTVIQGPAPKEAAQPELKKDSNETLAKAFPTEKSNVQDPPKWAFRYGQGNRLYLYPSMDFTMWPEEATVERVHFNYFSVGSSYSINKYVAFDLEVLILKAEERGRKISPFYRSEPKVLLPYFAVQLTPFRINVFSLDLMEFSFLIGATSSPREDEERTRPFFALRSAINITRNFSLDFRTKVTAIEGHENSSSLVWKF